MKKSKNLKTKTLLYFLGIIFVSIAIIWISKSLILNNILQNKKASEIERNTLEIVKIYENYETPQESIQKIAIENNYDVIIFKIEDNIGKIVFDNSSFYSDEKTNTALNRMLEKLGTTTQTIYTTTSHDNIKTLSMGKRTIIDNETVYFFVSTPIAVSGAENLSTNTWLLITSLCIFFVCAFASILFANKIANPLCDLKLKIANNQNSNEPIDVSFGTYEEIQDIELMLKTNIPTQNEDATSKLNLLNCINDEIKNTTANILEISSNLSKSKTLNKKTALGLKSIASQTSKIDNFLEDLTETNYLKLNRVQIDCDKFDLSSALTELCTSLENALPIHITDFSKSIAKDVSVVADKAKFPYAIKCAVLAFAEDPTNEKIKIRLAKVPSSENYKITLKTEKNPKLAEVQTETEQNSKSVALKFHLLEQILDKHCFSYTLDKTTSTLSITFAGQKEQKSTSCEETK